MIVEAGFADADAFGVLGEFANCGEVLRPLARRLMRMRPDGEKDAVVPLGDFRGLRSLRDLRADGDHALDAGGARSRDDRVEIVGEVGEIEVAMAVDEGHGADALALIRRFAPPSPARGRRVSPPLPHRASKDARLSTGFAG